MRVLVMGARWLLRRSPGAAGPRRDVRCAWGTPSSATGARPRAPKRWADHPAAPGQSGCRTRTSGRRFDLILFTVKTYDAEAAALAMRPVVGPETIVLPVQNGVDSVEQLSRILGTSLTGAAIIAPMPGHEIPYAVLKVRASTFGGLA